MPNVEVQKHELDEVYPNHLNKNVEVSPEFETWCTRSVGYAISPTNPSEGQSVRVAQLNAQKLMSFLGMTTTTTMLIKLKGNPELAKTLRSFLNNELDVNLQSLQEAPREN